MEQIYSTPHLGLIEALNASTSKILQFTGRSRRSEYWWTMLIVFLVNLFLTPLVGFLLDLATVPLTFRRLHDIGKSGWWYGVLFIMKFLFFTIWFVDIIMIIYYSTNNVDFFYGNVNAVIDFFAKYLIWFVIISIYQFVLLIFMCFDGDKYENDYGISPKYKIVEISDEEQED